ncbi:OB-fold nucleic acid binding domain-containing protein [Planctomicrobium sp. SH668]|uniref:OB-fold nucleic acid binding domain-containing protein n=1 Tax=Planctomicrobium sp. SH668 TaxID=3448126 RepID=UPI003F5B0956
MCSVRWGSVAGTHSGNALTGKEQGELLSNFSQSEQHSPLPLLAPFEEVTTDYQTTGLSRKAHPMSFLREQIEKLGAVPVVALQEIDDGKTVRIAGLVLLRQRQGTAKGVRFMIIEDETGQANLVVWPNTWEKHRRIARHVAALLVTGQIQKAEGIIHVVVKRLHGLTDHLTTIRS